MNYRHAFHAGNFADLHKHAILLAMLAALQEQSEALAVIDTHAGAGGYDLSGEMARRSGEAQAGIFRLKAAIDAPAVFAPRARRPPTSTVISGAVSVNSWARSTSASSGVRPGELR